MLLRTPLPFVSLALLLNACGGNVLMGTGGSGGTTSTSSGTTSGSTTSTSSGTTSSSTTSTSSGTTSSSGCVGSVSLVVDNGAPEKLGASCAGTWNPKMVADAEGYVFMGGPAPGIYALHVTGCASSAAVSEGLDISLSNAMSPGTYTMGLVRYTDPGGSGWGYSNDPFKVAITKLGAVGDTIEGNFSATVSHVMNGNAAHLLAGSFAVCRQPDELAP